MESLVVSFLAGFIFGIGVILLMLAYNLWKEADKKDKENIKNSSNPKAHYIGKE